MNPEDEKLLAYAHLTTAQSRLYVRGMTEEMPPDRREEFIQTQLERLTARAMSLNQRYDPTLPDDVRLRLVASLNVFNKRSEGIRRTLSKPGPITIDDAGRAIGDLAIIYGHLWTAGIGLN